MGRSPSTPRHSITPAFQHSCLPLLYVPVHQWLRPQKELHEHLPLHTMRIPCPAADPAVQLPPMWNAGGRAVPTGAASCFPRTATTTTSPRTVPTTSATATTSDAGLPRTAPVSAAAAGDPARDASSIPGRPATAARFPSGIRAAATAGGTSTARHASAAGGSSVSASSRCWPPPGRRLPDSADPTCRRNANRFSADSRRATASTASRWNTSPPRPARLPGRSPATPAAASASAASRTTALRCRHASCSTTAGTTPWRTDLSDPPAAARAHTRLSCSPAASSTAASTGRTPRVTTRASAAPRLPRTSPAAGATATADAFSHSVRVPAARAGSNHSPRAYPTAGSRS